MKALKILKTRYVLGKKVVFVTLNRDKRSKSLERAKKTEKN